MADLPALSDLPELLTHDSHHSSWLSRAQLRGLVVRALPGVYLRADVASDLAWRARAAMAWRSDAVVCHGLAARLTFWRDRPVDVVDVVARTELRRAGYRFHHRQVPARLVSVYGALRITVPALTALDLCLVDGPDAIDRVLRSRLVRVDDLHQALAMTPHRRGNRDRRREVLAARTEPWSAAERLAHSVLLDAGITGWRANLPVKIDLWTSFIDIAFDEDRLAVEIDGRAFHDDAEAFEEDRERQNDLVTHGWMVLRFTWKMLRERPDYVVDTVRRGRRLARRLQRIRHSTPDRGPLATVSARD